MILIITDKFDEHANVVVSKLIKLNQPFFRFNLDVSSLESTIIKFDNDIWCLEQEGKSVTNSDISSIWFRRAFVELLLEEKDNREPDFLMWKNEWNKILLGFYISLSNIPSLCPLRQSYAAENKFLQYTLAKEIGLKMPNFITANDKQSLVKFANLNENNVVLKLHHQDFYKVDNSYKGLYVNRINADELRSFKEFGENPITLQQYIEKEYEVRYTVVGNKHFCCRIDSQCSDITKTDWRRYDIPNTPHLISSAPDLIKN